MRALAGTAAERYVRSLENRGSRIAQFEPQVRRSVDDVRRNGDRALRKYAQRWDGLEKDEPFRVAPEEINAAWTMCPREVRQALRRAAANIRRFCQWQKPREWRRQSDGICLGQLVRPLDAVGCYVPGGRYPLPSTLLMTVIPAQVAGVKRIAVVSPRPQIETLAAAALLGITEVYGIGGAQAVAALAYGTASVPRVDKIVGPGNLYVTAAKKLVAFDCSIDFLAGPTEVVIVSSAGNPRFIAFDLVAQAEHDPEAISIFITTSRDLARAVAAEVKDLAENNSTAQRSLAASGAILLAASRGQALTWANALAPEHVTIEAQDVPHIRNAGSVFVGDFSPQAAGDYASGPNHVLPTAGAARCRGGLSVLDFVKLITLQELSREGLQKIAPAIVTLADAERLVAHAQSVRGRFAHA